VAVAAAPAARAALTATRRGRGRNGAVDHLAAIEAAIKELEQCRTILLESMGKAEHTRPARRARAVGA